MKNGEKLLLSCVAFAGAWVISEYASVYLVKATIGTGRIFTGFSYLLLGILVYQWKYFSIGDWLDHTGAILVRFFLYGG